MKTWFDEYGNFIGELSDECVADCSSSGDVTESVEYWRDKIGWCVPRAMAILYLGEFGAWPKKTDEYDTGLDDMEDEELAAKVLWIACGEVSENGAWFGLVH